MSLVSYLRSFFSNHRPDFFELLKSKDYELFWQEVRYGLPDEWLSKQDENGNTLLHLIIPFANEFELSYQVDIINFLLQCGCEANLVNHNGQTPLHCSAVENYLNPNLIDNTSSENINRHDCNGETVLTAFLSPSKLFIHNSSLEYLLKKGANPDIPTKDGRYPIDIAFDCRFDTLSRAGVDSMFRRVCLLLEHQTTHKTVPFLFLEKLLTSSNPERLFTLTSLGISLDQTDNNGNTLLHSFVKLKTIESAHRTLIPRLARVIDTNKRNKDGDTPLMLCCRQTGPDINWRIQQLMAVGAIAYLRNNTGQTPYQIAFTNSKNFINGTHTTLKQDSLNRKAYSLIMQITSLMSPTARNTALSCLISQYGYSEQIPFQTISASDSDPFFNNKKDMSRNKRTVASGNTVSKSILLRMNADQINTKE